MFSFIGSRTAFPAEKLLIRRTGKEVQLGAYCSHVGKRTSVNKPKLSEACREGGVE